MSRNSLRLAVKARAWNPTEAEWMKAAQCIQPEEKERIGRFVFKKDAKSAMVGRLLIRRVVSSILDIPYKTVKLARTDKGKPYVVSMKDDKMARPPCQFNISHQGDYVVIAADEKKQVGADVMKVEWPRKSSVQEFFSMMKRHLTEQEWSKVLRCNEDLAQLKVFYRYWCLKESVLKALGTGIGLELSRLDFHTEEELDPEEVINTTYLKMDGVNAPNWVFEETMLDDHCIAIALQDDNPDDDESIADSDSAHEEGPEPFTVWSIEQLLSECTPLPSAQPDQAYWDNFAAKPESPNLVTKTEAPDFVDGGEMPNLDKKELD